MYTLVRKYESNNPRNWWLWVHQGELVQVGRGVHWTRGKVAYRWDPEMNRPTELVSWGSIRRREFNHELAWATGELELLLAMWPKLIAAFDAREPFIEDLRESLSIQRKKQKEEMFKVIVDAELGVTLRSTQN